MVNSYCVTYKVTSNSSQVTTSAAVAKNLLACHSRMYKTGKTNNTQHFECASLLQEEMGLQQWGVVLREIFTFFPTAAVVPLSPALWLNSTQCSRVCYNRLKTP